MAKRDAGLYKSMRSKGVRKSMARTVAEAAQRAKGGGKAPKGLRRAVGDLRSVVADLEDRARGGPAKRKAAGKKAARTRKRKAAERSARGKKGARTRARNKPRSG